MNLSLQGKIAIVTGGSKGIGWATALALAEEGVDVAICARGLDALNAAAAEIRSKTGRNVVAIQADMGVPEDIRNLVATTAAELGGVDILVNNAVSPTAAPFTELADEDWQRHLNVKVMGYVRCSREVIPHMRQRGGGRIINVGGMAARNVNALANSFGVANAAASNIAKNLSDQVAQYGILVNCVHPGATRTTRQTVILDRQARDAHTNVEQAEQEAISRIPIGRMIEPTDIANLVLFLVSNRAGAITGQTIGVDGGASRGIFY